MTTYTPASSCIAHLDYDEEEGTAYVTFTDGAQITIENFPAIEVERWMNAASVGGYWNANLRGKY
jgi:KTSC domain